MSAGPSISETPLARSPAIRTIVPPVMSLCESLLLKSSPGRRVSCALLDSANHRFAQAKMKIMSEGYFSKPNLPFKLPSLSACSCHERFVVVFVKVLAMSQACHQLDALKNYRNHLYRSSFLSPGPCETNKCISIIIHRKHSCCKQFANRNECIPMFRDAKTSSIFHSMPQPKVSSIFSCHEDLLQLFA